MRTQQQAERAEQLRIKNLVLNYDLSNDDAQDGESAFHYVLQENGIKRNRLVGKGVLNDPLDFNNPVAKSRRKRDNSTQQSISLPGLSAADTNASKATPADHTSAAFDAQSSYSQPRIDKAGNTRNVQRARKLQLSDADW